MLPEEKKYRVIKNFKSHCVCQIEFQIGDIWELTSMVSKKRALVSHQGTGGHKVKLSRALTNSEEL